MHSGLEIYIGECVHIWLLLLISYTCVHTFCSVNGEAADIDPQCSSHDDYLTEFKSMLFTKLRNAIDADISSDPDCVKGRKKTVQV